MQCQWYGAVLASWCVCQVASCCAPPPPFCTFADRPTCCSLSLSLSLSPSLSLRAVRHCVAKTAFQTLCPSVSKSGTAGQRRTSGRRSGRTATDRRTGRHTDGEASSTWTCRPLRRHRRMTRTNLAHGRFLVAPQKSDLPFPLVVGSKKPRGRPGAKATTVRWAPITLLSRPDDT